MFRTAARTATRTARGLRLAQRVSRRNFNNKSTYSGSNKLLFVAAGLVPVTIAAILLQKKETPPPIEIYEVKLGRVGSGEDADEDDEDEDEEEEGEASEAVIIEEETSEPAEDTENAESTEAAGSQSAAYNPETGEINWDCPCLGGMADGPCGEEFKEAFACFVYSETEPKGIDCITKFQNMRNCFKEHPEHYKEELFEDEEAERDAEAGAIEILEVEPQAGEVVEIVDVVDGNGEVIAEIVEVVDVVDATEAPEAEAAKVEEASSAESLE